MWKLKDNIKLFNYLRNDFKYRFKMAMGFFVLSLILVALSFTTALGYTQKDIQMNKSQNNQDVASKNVADSGKGNVVDNTLSKEKTINITKEISNPDYASQFPVNFILNGYTKIATIHYGYMDEDGTTFIDLPSFQTYGITKDSSYLFPAGDGTSGYVFRDSPNSTNTTPDFQWSHWDVRYFEETFTYDSHTYAFSNCYLTHSDDYSRWLDPVQCSKLTYAKYGEEADQQGWFYRNDLASESPEAPWKLYDQNKDTFSNIWIVFKDVTRHGTREKALTQLDLSTYWDSEGAHKGTARVQYCYTDAKQGVSARTYYKMDPPFAGDLNLSYANDISQASPMTFNNYCGRYVRQKEGNDTYDCAYYTTYIQIPGVTNWIEAYAITCADSDGHPSWYYKQTASDGWTLLGNASNEIYVSITYDYSSISVTPTVDSIEQNITINCFDYDAWRDITPTTSGSYTPFRYSRGINTFSDFKFSSSENGNGGEVDDWADWDTSIPNINRIVQGEPNTYCRRGIWANTLGDDGFPRLNAESIWNKSKTDLSYLFSTNSYSAKHDYRNLNHLFYQDVYDDYGYYYFDSGGLGSTEYADQGHFAQLRKKPDNVGVSTQDGIDCYDNSSDFVLFTEPSTDDVKFAPWNDKDNSVADNRDMLFGMQILTNFIQPENGQINWKDKGNQDMTFHFRGDDDVYLYIDDVLVLDLGGVHGVCEGHIDFATGMVYRQATSPNQPLEEISLYQLYDDAGKASSIDWIDSTLSDEKIYKSFSTHSFAFYYFERGERSSDCFCAFNLPTMPVGSYEIGHKYNYSGSSILQTDSKLYYKVQDWVEDPSYGEGGYWEDFNGIYNIYEGSVGSHSDEVIATRHSEQILLGTSQKPINGVIWFFKEQVAEVTGYDFETKLRIVELDPRDYDISTKWKKFVYDSYHGYEEAKRINIANEGNWYGWDEDMVVGESVGITFMNTLNNWSILDNFYVTKTVNNESPTYLKIYFDGYVEGDSPPCRNKLFIGDAWIRSIRTGSLQSISTDENGIFTVPDGYELRFTGIQLDTLVTVEEVEKDGVLPKTITYSVIEYDYDNYQKGSMIAAYNDFNYTFAANLPPLIPQSSQAPNFGRIYFEVEDSPQTLILANKTEGFYADKLKKFEAGVTLYDKEGNIYKPNQLFQGKLYRNSGSEETINIQCIVENGEVKIYDTSQTWLHYSYPELANDDYIIIGGILPPDGGYVLPWVEKDDFYFQTFNHVTSQTLGIELFLPYIPGSPTEGKEYISTNTGLISLVTDEETGETLANSFYMKNSNNSPISGFDIFKNPDLLIFLFATLLFLLVYGPVKLMLIRKNRNKI